MKKGRVQPIGKKQRNIKRKIKKRKNRRKVKNNQDKRARSEVEAEIESQGRLQTIGKTNLNNHSQSRTNK